MDEPDDDPCTSVEPPNVSPSFKQVHSTPNKKEMMFPWQFAFVEASAQHAAKFVGLFPPIGH
jgi:hypothetical protein